MPYRFALLTKGDSILIVIAPAINQIAHTHPTLAKLQITSFARRSIKIESPHIVRWADGVSSSRGIGLGELAVQVIRCLDRYF